MVDSLVSSFFFDPGSFFSLQDVFPWTSESGNCHNRQATFSSLPPISLRSPSHGPGPFSRLVLDTSVSFAQPWLAERV